MNKFNHSSLLIPDVWNNYVMSCENKLLTNALIKEMLTKFWDDIMNKIDNKMIFLIFRIQFEDKTYRTIGNLQKIDKSNLENLYNLLTNLLTLINQDYKTLPILNIVFSYKIIETDNKNSKIDSFNIKSTKLPTFKFYGYNFPLTLDFKLWGKEVFHENNHYKIKRPNSDLFYDITVEPLFNIIKIIDYDNITILTFKDVKDINSKDNSTFTRLINNQIYHINNGQLIVKTLKKSNNLLTNLKKDKKLMTKFITLDIETQTINNVMTPYSICFYDGKKVNSFYITNYKDSNEMLRFSIFALLKRKYNGYKIYVHNLSNFDGIFLLKILSSLSNINIKPIIKDNKIIEIKIIFDKYNIAFRDSFLILPSSLNNLTKQFNVENKTIFPYNFVNNKFNKKINLNYSGNVPKIKYFTNITLNQYINYKNFFKQWSLKDETINYCSTNCISLYQVIEKFNNLIFDNFTLNIHKYPTLPSLALAIFRTNYLNDYEVPLISGQIFNDINKSYTGAFPEMFKIFGENNFDYDVNSLYPYIMKTFEMPIGNIKFFEGNILKIDPKAFGFFECKVIAPKNLKYPILQIKCDTGKTIRNIDHLDNWTGVYFSEEIFNAMKFGYKFEILRGYTFERKNIFKNYIADLTKISQSSNKDEPLYLISKLLMNSLYGRFGMNELLFTHKIINENDLISYNDKYSINEIISLNNNKLLISYFDTNDITKLLLNNKTYSNISIGIASAIAAYARIHMTQFKNNPEYNLSYSDTDSININKNTPL